MIIYDLSGNKAKEISLPSQLNEPYHPNLIKRAVLAIQSNKRQSYGSKTDAGMRHSAKTSKRRKEYRGSYGKSLARVPRKVMWHRGTQFSWEGAIAPGTKGGRKAHPPKAEKDTKVKINRKERRKAIRSALSTTFNETLVKKRNHIFKLFPLIVINDIESLKKAKEVHLALEKLGLKEELERTSIKKVRAGKGKARGRKYKKKTGPLIVVSESCSLSKAGKNIPGVEIAKIDKLNTELLAPGAHPGRLTIYSEKAIEKLTKENLYL
jgi:large subunit ribosomal protein L4e